MSKSVWQVELFFGQSDVQVPKGAQIVGAAILSWDFNRQAVPVLFVVADSYAQLETRRFVVVPTNVPFDDQGTVHVATFYGDRADSVGHVFEVGRYAMATDAEAAPPQDDHVEPIVFRMIANGLGPLTSGRDHRVNETEVAKLRAALHEAASGAVSISGALSQLDITGRIVQALEIADRYGTTDGEWHKSWVIDQMVRALTGKDYDAWVVEHKAGNNGPDTYGWDTGVAP
jgi:hypothetical protein